MTTIASKPTGQTGTLIIDDSGGYISFKIANSGSQTWISGGKWSGKVNNVAVSGTFNISGVQTVTVGKWRVSTDQTVSFTMAATGTSGLGGPTTVSAAVHRATKPGAPGKPVVSNITTDRATFSWSAASNGGSAIQNYGLYVSTSSSYTSYAFQAWVGTGLSYTVPAGQFKPATKYYARDRATNAVGTGPYSSSTTFITDPATPATPTLSGAGPDRMTVAWSRGSNGNALAGFDVQYSRSGDFTDAVTKSYGATTYSATISGLLPGREYSWRVRSKSTGGVSSSWSPVVKASTVPAIRMSNGSSWQWCDVLISDGTTWQPAEMLISDGTTWLTPA